MTRWLRLYATVLLVAVAFLLNLLLGEAVGVALLVVVLPAAVVTQFRESVRGARGG